MIELILSKIKLLFEYLINLEYVLEISSFPKICNSAKFNIYADGSPPTNLLIVHPIYWYGMSKIVGNTFS